MPFLTLIIAPLASVVMFLYLRNHRDKDFIRLLIRSFIAGCFSVVFLLIALGLSQRLGIGDCKNLRRTLFFAFVTSAFSAEFGKFIVLRYFILTRNVTVTGIDAILLSTNTALGFSTMALLLFALNVFNFRQSLPDTLFALTFIPANLMFSVVMGFFIGMSRLLHTHIVYSLTGLFGAIFFHGIFNFCLLTRDFKLLSVYAFGSSLIVFILALKATFAKPED